MVTLQYGSFTALEEWAKVVALTTRCSKRVADRALRGQLFLDELRREHLDSKTIQHQERGLFLLERSHNTAAMQRKEYSGTHKGAPTHNRLIKQKWPWNTLQ